MFIIYNVTGQILQLLIFTNLKVNKYTSRESYSTIIIFTSFLNWGQIFKEELLSSEKNVFLQTTFTSSGSLHGSKQKLIPLVKKMAEKH